MKSFEIKIVPLRDPRGRSCETHSVTMLDLISRSTMKAVLDRLLKKVAMLFTVQ